MCEKFQINMMRYGEYPNEKSIKEIVPESYRGESMQSLQNY